MFCADVRPLLMLEWLVTVQSTLSCDFRIFIDMVPVCG